MHWDSTTHECGVTVQALEEEKAKLVGRIQNEKLVIVAIFLTIQTLMLFLVLQQLFRLYITNTR
jgi:hypothetical protein